MLKNTFNMYTKVNALNKNALTIARRGITTCPRPTRPDAPRPPGERPFLHFIMRKIWDNFRCHPECDHYSNKPIICLVFNAL